MKELIRFAACLVPCAWLAIPATAQAQLGSIIVVTTTVDSVVGNDGICSLREAIIASNTNTNADINPIGCQGTGTDQIRFAVGAGNPQFNLVSALPEITAPVTIRGNTGGATRVVLHRAGGGSFPGLVIKANGTTVLSLVINNFGSHGIVIQATGVTVTGSLIGTAADGVTPLGNGGNGIAISGPAGASNHIIGGTGAGQANVIAFNQTGVSIAGVTGNAIRGNSIHDNGGLGIDNINGGNGELTPPSIDQADLTVSGTSACSFCPVDVFADSWEEGQTYLGSTTTNGSGVWSFGSPPPGPYVTATITNASGSSSEFSLPHRCRDSDLDEVCDAVDDSDVDGIADGLDNCILAPNGPALPDSGGNSQLDADSDTYGNRCDGDLNNNGGNVNVQDYAIFRSKLGTSNAIADLSGNGTVNVQDYAIFRTLLGLPPGPSGPNRPPCTPGAIGCGWHTNEVITYDESAWGTYPSPASTLLFNTLPTVYPSGLVVGGSNTILFDRTVALVSFLGSQTGPANVLNFSYVNPDDTSAGHFASEVISLQLNVDYAEVDQLPGVVDFGDLYICKTGEPGLDGLTVAQFLGVANDILGADPTPLFSVGTASAVTGLLNGSFFGGAPSIFAQENLYSVPCT